VHRHFRDGRTDKVNHSQPCTETIPESDSIVGNTDLIRCRGTILLVEDESLLREVTCEIIESAGYWVLKAGTAAEAISAFDEYKTIVRLLLTDVVLPGQNGLDLATDLRYVCPKPRIIFVSGYPKMLSPDKASRKMECSQAFRQPRRRPGDLARFRTPCYCWRWDGIRHNRPRTAAAEKNRTS
jgi:CheY-like chemotaxis protein